MNRSAPRHAAPERDSARDVAVDALHTVLNRGQPIDETFDARSSKTALAERDRAFAYILVATTLRRLGQIDDLIDHCLARPLPARAAVVRTILRLGVCQLVFLETPAHAAVDTAVALARSRKQGHHLALVNAVLRRIATEGARSAAAQDAPRLNTPRWLASSWSRAYGDRQSHQIAAAHLVEPPLDITARVDPQSAAAMLGATVLPTGTLRLHRAGPVTALPGFTEGAWWVQDAAAALPARLFGDVDGRRIVDLCAAPGGKTAQLAAAGASVIAVDRAPNRLERLRQNMARLGLAAETVAADAERWRPATPVDAVLVDAPCSATGTIRRHPDVAWLKSQSDVEALADLQIRLLAAASQMVRPGGLVVYCACSLQPEEGVEQIEALGRAGIPLVRKAVQPEELVGGTDFISEQGDLRTLPSQWQEIGGLDGFFAARLQRV